MFYRAQNRVAQSAPSYCCRPYKNPERVCGRPTAASYGGKSTRAFQTTTGPDSRWTEDLLVVERVFRRIGAPSGWPPKAPAQ